MKKELVLKAIMSTKRNLSAYTINNLSADTIKNLSAYTIKKIKAIWNSVPLLSDPYTELLKDINDKTRVYKQYDWGDIEDYNANQNVCETAMCIAGHFVNMGGEDGYKLKKEYGWGKAAGLIHLKVHPTAPVFNYNLTDNSNGMAYIEMMAEFEGRKNKKQTFSKWVESYLKAD